MNELLESRIHRIKFSRSIPGADRIHYVNEDDVRVVLRRLPFELWQRLRTVHFNDRSRGARVLGYVTRGRHDIALCAQPPRTSLTLALRGMTAEHFGAKRGRQWPTLSVRRFMLYSVFLHEIGHMQLIDPNRPSERLRFAREKLAEQFAQQWCKRLWSIPFDHPDPVHNPPSPEELSALT